MTNPAVSEKAALFTVGDRTEVPPTYRESNSSRRTCVRIDTSCSGCGCVSYTLNHYFYPKATMPQTYIRDICLYETRAVSSEWVRLWARGDMSMGNTDTKTRAINPFRTAVPFRGHTTQISSSLSPKRGTAVLDWLIMAYLSVWVPRRGVLFYTWYATRGGPFYCTVAPQPRFLRTDE